MAGFPERLYRQDTKRQGRDVVLIRKPTAEVDPSKPWLGPVAPSDPDKTTVRAKLTGFSTDEVDGQTIKRTDQRCLIAPADLNGVPPSVSDQIDDGGTIFGIVDVTEKRPGTTAHVYQLQLRA